MSADRLELKDQSVTKDQFLALPFEDRLSLILEGIVDPRDFIVPEEPPRVPGKTFELAPRFKPYLLGSENPIGIGSLPDIMSPKNFEFGWREVKPYLPKSS